MSLRTWMIVLPLLPMPLAAGELSAEVATSVSAAQELARKVVAVGEKKVTYIKITPPLLPPPVITPTPQPRTLTAEEQATEDARAAKAFVQLNLSVTVYPGTAELPTISDLNWWHEGKRYQAWSNIDFRYFNQFTTIEAEHYIFSWFPGIGEGSVDSVHASNRPAGYSLFAVTDTAPQYYFEGEAADMAAVADTLAGLDYFHAYFSIHKEELAVEYKKRLSEAEAAERARFASPPKKLDSVIYFWKK